MKLSVIIVSYNVEKFLNQCLVSVERAIQHVGTAEVEVFVVDNDSVDGTCDLVKSKFPWVTLIENKENTPYRSQSKHRMHWNYRTPLNLAPRRLNM